MKTLYGHPAWVYNFDPYVLVLQTCLDNTRISHMHTFVLVVENDPNLIWFRLAQIICVRFLMFRGTKKAFE